MAAIHIPKQAHVLIAGPTASGKSALALEIAQTQGGVIVNADALQVFEAWKILTAQPPEADLHAAPHLLYGHVPRDKAYSVGAWLTDILPIVKNKRAIIVGGTGLYFSALTEGLSDIPSIPPAIREEGNRLTINALINDLDPETRSKIDLNNRMRVQRAWEVLQATDRPLAQWQSDPKEPALPLTDVVPILLDAPKDWLTPRIETRFDLMIDAGVLDEAREMRVSWSPEHPSSKAIGAADLIAHVDGDISLDEARERIVIATRQYAKRQRTWFKKRMADWHVMQMPDLDLGTALTLER